MTACSGSGIRYPESRVSHQVDHLHGVEVADPYRWLEDLDSEETRHWIQQQNELSFGLLAQLPNRERLLNRLTELWNYPRYGVPRRGGARYFFTRNNGLQNQSVLYYSEQLDQEGSQLLDPNLLSADGTVALVNWRVSPDGNHLAYGLSVAGSDWQEWKVRNVGSGEDETDHLKWIKFSEVSWSSDSKGFHYSRYDEPSPGQELSQRNYYHKLYYHVLGSPQAEDQLVYERADQQEWLYTATVTDDGRYLILEVSKGTQRENGVFYRELSRPGAEFVELLNQFDASYEFVGNQGTKLWFLTTLEAPRGRLIEIDLSRPLRENWKTIIEERAFPLETVKVLNRQLVGLYLTDAHNQVQVFTQTGQPLSELSLPGKGSVAGFTGRPNDTETFFSYASFAQPETIYRHDFGSNESSLFREPEVAFDPSRYETHQIFFVSKDGTRIPMFVTHAKDLKRNGQNPTLLYGYGGFNISLTPSFAVANLVLLEEGGVYAVANLRGGGEYGEEWHQAGMKLEKQNVFDDFISAAQWLIQQGYTTASGLAIEGRSNGGLLVGAAMTQRPELFGVAIPHVGVMDMLRFHRFTIGWAWVSDYGSPEDPEEFRALRDYSPYHNLRPGTHYPATLITTAEQDDRVVPAHSFKFAAALQAAQGGPAPVIIRVETRAGHGAGKPTSKRIEEAADKLAFLLANVGP